jgi:hypothetical protein
MQLAWGIHYETMSMLEGMNNDAENASLCLISLICVSLCSICLLDFGLSSVVWVRYAEVVASLFFFCSTTLRLLLPFFLGGQKWGAGSSLLARLFVQMDFNVELWFFLLKSASF